MFRRLRQLTFALGFVASLVVLTAQDAVAQYPAPLGGAAGPPEISPARTVEVVGAEAGSSWGMILAASALLIAVVALALTARTSLHAGHVHSR